MKTESLIGKFFKETLPTITRKIIAFLQSIGARIASLRGKFATNRTTADPLVHNLLTSITMYMRKAIGVYSDLKGMGNKPQNIDKEWANNKNQELTESIDNIKKSIEDIKDYYFNTSTGKAISESIASNAQKAIMSWTKWISLIEKTINSIRVNSGQADPRYGFIGTIQQGFSAIHQSGALISQIANSVEVKKEQDTRSQDGGDNVLRELSDVRISINQMRRCNNNINEWFMKHYSEEIKIIDRKINENMPKDTNMTTDNESEIRKLLPRLHEIANGLKKQLSPEDKLLLRNSVV